MRFFNSLLNNKRKSESGFYVKDNNGNLYYMTDNGKGEYKIYDKY
jgi:hypothetical protein